jgi:hypothetical protein
MSQGSSLGSLLVLFCINDTANAIPEHDVKLFANDPNLFIADRNTNLLNVTANDSIMRFNT